MSEKKKMIRVVIIDDEPAMTSALQIILNDYCPETQIVAITNSPSEAAGIIEENRPDLVFIDVQMPPFTGFDVLRMVENRTFEVIFVTAYQEFALKAIKENAVDYLLKPVSIPEVIESVKKATQRILSGKFRDYKSLLASVVLPQQKKIGLPTTEGVVFVNKMDIVRVEASQSYSELHLVTKKKILISKNLTDFELMLNDPTFFRAHRSHLVNIEHVVKYNTQGGGEIELTDGSLIGLSRRNRDSFLQQMSELRS